MARKLAFKEKRGDVCVMPYGINTPGAFAFIYVIILPTYYGCISSHEKAYCQELAWYVALASNFITGIILLLLCVFGEFIRQNTPSVALLSSISGLGFVYLALNEYLPVAATPIVSFVPFAVVMLGFFGGGMNEPSRLKLIIVNIISMGFFQPSFSYIWSFTGGICCVSNRYSSWLDHFTQSSFCST